jgi:hypothetical protein
MEKGVLKVSYQREIIKSTFFEKWVPPPFRRLIRKRGKTPVHSTGQVEAYVAFYLLI